MEYPKLLGSAFSICTEWTTEARNDTRELVNMMHVIIKCFMQLSNMSSLLLSTGECPSTRNFLQGISP